MNNKFKIGDRVIYTRKGKYHTPAMDRFIGKVVTIRRFEPHDKCMLANIKEDNGAIGGYYYDIRAFVLATSKIR